MNPMPLQQATFGSGCFWCSEAVFRRVRGVEGVISGYSGGTVDHPTYEDVCSGRTGHAEVVQVTFDPSVVSFSQLVEIFFGTHDPTTKNRQGNDIGEQYRSVIFTHDERQWKAAETVKAQLERDHIFNSPIVTEIVPFRNFFPAESYHRNYYEQNPDQAYCRAVIDPKIAKFRERFTALLKDS